MFKKLLFVFVLTFSIEAISQLVITTPPDLEATCGDNFDLTSQDALILNGQDPSNFIISYHLTLQDAQNIFNEITNPSSYTGFDGQIIYVSVQDLSNDDGEIAITNFSLVVGEGPIVLDFPDVTTCDFYALPPLPNGNYYQAPNGVGLIPISQLITSSMTIFVYESNGICSDESNFFVTVIPTPSIPELSDVTACDSYILPVLPANMNYFTASGGTGTMLFPGTEINEDMLLYVYALNQFCQNEGSFNVVINEDSGVEQIEDVVSCNSYTLPPLPSGAFYSFNGVQLAGIEPFIITQSGTVTLHVPDVCSQSFFVEIIDVTPNGLEPFTACDNDGDGFAVFDLESIIYAIGMPSYADKFYETFADADMQVSEITDLNYTNIIPNTQTIYVRIIANENCYSINEIILQTIECSSISGTVRADLNSNGCTDTDAVMANIQMGCYGGNNVIYAYTNADGYYSFSSVPIGEYAIMPDPVLSGYVVTPEMAELTVTGTITEYTADFCALPPPPFTDAVLYIMPLIQPRPGFPANYIMQVINNGTTPISGTATFNYDPAALVFVSTSPAFTTQTTNSITFNFSNLAPSQFLNYYINFTVMIPPTVDAGDILISSAAVSIDQTDEYSANNTATLEQIVVNSYDPNDITCHEGEFISPSQASDYLHYTIRFQNTGTADAVNVRLENILDPLLNSMTFQPIASSHPYQAERDDNSVVFRYNNIMLPGSSDDEPGSHGFVTYKIKPLAGLDIGEIISNTANIFFDFNAPITTNTAITQIQVLAVNENQLPQIQVYPNPATGIVNIRCEGADRLQIAIVDLQGKVIYSGEQIVSDNVASVSIDGIASGMYFVEIGDGEDVAVKKLIVK